MGWQIFWWTPPVGAFCSSCARMRRWMHADAICPNGSHPFETRGIVLGVLLALPERSSPGLAASCASCANDEDELMRACKNQHRKRTILSRLQELVMLFAKRSKNQSIWCCYLLWLDAKVQKWTTNISSLLESSKSQAVRRLYLPSSGIFVNLPLLI